VYVGALDCLCLQLSGLLVLLLNPLDLLLLYVDGCDLHAEDYVLDLALSETRHVHVVLLGVVGENQVLQFDLDLHPLLIRQVWPNVVRKGHRGLVRLQYDLGTLGVQVECTQNQDQSAEGSEGLNRLQPIVIQIE